jgi:hypothetical protein
MTVVKVQPEPMGMWFTTVWKSCERQSFQNMIKEVLCAVTMLLSHHINAVESIDSRKNSQHEFLGPDLLFDLLRDIISRYARFLRMMKFQSEPTPIPSRKTLKLIFLVNFETGQ